MTAMQALGAGVANVDWLHTDSSAANGLGIYRYWSDDGGANDDTPDDGGTIRVSTNGHWQTITFGIDFGFGDYITVRFENAADAQVALTKTVEKGDCREMLNRVLSNIKNLKSLGYANPVRADDVLDLFNNINSQKEGGFSFDKSVNEAMEVSYRETPGSKPVAGGGGLTFYGGSGRAHNKQGVPLNGPGGEMFVFIFPRGQTTFDYNTNKPASQKVMQQRISSQRAALTGILIHEMFHAAGLNATFTHEDMDAAAISVDKDTKSFDDFVKKHCGVGF